MGRLAALGRFISQFTDPLKPFFATLRGANRPGWNKECDRAFTQIKQYLAEPPILASPDIGENLFVYLAVSDTAVSSVLFKENEDGKQRPVFFVSMPNLGAQIRILSYSRRRGWHSPDAIFRIGFIQQGLMNRLPRRDSAPSHALP